MVQGSTKSYNLDTGILTGDAQQQHTQNSSSEAPAPELGVSLPSVDTGKEAWLFLTACWGVEADYYSNHDPFAGSGHIAAVGTTTSMRRRQGIMYLGTSFIDVIWRLYPRPARWLTLAGDFLASLAVAMSPFSNSVPQLIRTQGIVFLIGTCVAYCSCILFIDEWAIRRRGMAYGIVWSAAGTATRTCAGILFACSAPLTFFVKPRLPCLANPHQKPINMRFVSSKFLGLHRLVNVVYATEDFFPAIYLPVYACTNFETSSYLAAFTAMLINISATICLVVMGSLGDKLPVTTYMIISAAGITAFVIFCVMYGIVAGSWASICEGRGHANPVMVRGNLRGGKGVRKLVSEPLDGSLIKVMPWQEQVMGGYGSGSGILILYTGLTGLSSGMNFLWKRLDLL
ncbi:hypothetical protein EV356DRAFT_521883 [Viridothelium virens]|uniref:MFS general substrate transporter n=1 Tax=Viridothelium virens TaxID=1048519 RepID=A0A6A6GT40_VIRVR|nr:hypothetical protein EV356DRAFT_521883 [Viridothelium virens]